MYDARIINLFDIETIQYIVTRFKSNILSVTAEQSMKLSCVLKKIIITYSTRN